MSKIRHCVIIFQTYLEAAKTKFTKNYKGMNPSKITTTVGLNIGKIDIAGIRLNFWDLGGQEELQSLWDKVRFLFLHVF
jgi:ADP-ribosylation factor related protein 1